MCVYLIIFMLINPFHATGLFLFPLKTSENQRFSNILRGYRKRPVSWNGLRTWYLNTSTLLNALSAFVSCMQPSLQGYILNKGWAIRIFMCFLFSFLSSFMPCVIYIIIKSNLPSKEFINASTTRSLSQPADLQLSSLKNIFFSLLWVR